MPRHKLAIARAIAISNAIHCIHKSNVKLHELEVYSQHNYYSSYMPTYISLSTFLLVT